MINRITGMNNPDFFFMSYTKSNWLIKDFFFVPKHFFTPEIIEKKKAPYRNCKESRMGWMQYSAG